jgi:hypothetical protein
MISPQKEEGNVNDRDNDTNDLARYWALAVGIALVGAGLLGFIDNPIVSRPEADPIFHTDALHNIIHIATGALALYIAFGLRGEMRANALIAFGAAYGLVLLATLVSPNLFGLFEHPVNAADHLLHLVLSAGSIAVGWMARTGTRTGGLARTR